MDFLPYSLKKKKPQWDASLKKMYLPYLHEKQSRRKRGSFLSADFLSAWNDQNQARMKLRARSAGYISHVGDRYPRIGATFAASGCSSMEPD